MSGRRYLLDSNVLIWLETGNARLRPEILARLDEAEACFLSAATAWELGMKVAAGKLRMRSFLAATMRTFRLLELPIRMKHGEIAAQLPGLHRDPFDRMIVAQAQEEHLILVTGDKKLAEYGVPVLLV